MAMTLAAAATVIGLAWRAARRARLDAERLDRRLASLRGPGAAGREGTR